MSVPAIKSSDMTETAIDLEKAFPGSLTIARDVAKGVILRYLGKSIENQGICDLAHQILEHPDNPLYDKILTISNSSSIEKAHNNSTIQLPYSGNTIGPTSTFLPAITSNSNSNSNSNPNPSYQKSNNPNPHFLAQYNSQNPTAQSRYGTPFQNFHNHSHNSHFPPPQSNFNTIQNQSRINGSRSQSRPHIPMSNIHRGNSYQQLPPSTAINSGMHNSGMYNRNRLNSLSSLHRQVQAGTITQKPEYPRQLENLFSRSHLALSTSFQSINPMNIDYLHMTAQSERVQTYSNLPHDLQQAFLGSPLHLQRSNSNHSLPSDTLLPPLVSPPTSSPQPENLLVESRSCTESRSTTPHISEMTKSANPKKRKAQTTEKREGPAKKPKVEKSENSENSEKSENSENSEKSEKSEKSENSEKSEKSENSEKSEKSEKSENSEKSEKAAKAAKAAKFENTNKAKYNLPAHLWMRILECSPPIFLKKARLISKDIKSMVDNFTSIHNNNRIENFGYAMPDSVPGLSPKEYLDLLGGKGCQEGGCSDKHATRAHWAWKKRWCLSCWKSKIEREDRVVKNHQNQYGRVTFEKLLQCIPAGMYDSFNKPHDFVDERAVRPSTAPRLYKYYVVADVERITAEYGALTPAPYVENPNHDAQQKAVALQIYQEKMEKLEEVRDEFLTAKKGENDELMKLVIRIEAGVRQKRDKVRKPNDENRAARKALFTTSAERDIPEIPIWFVHKTEAFKAATRIFRDPGSERGWRSLMPKIVKEWRDHQRRQGVLTSIDEELASVNKELASVNNGEVGSVNNDNQNKQNSQSGNSKDYDMEDYFDLPKNVSDSIMSSLSEHHSQHNSQRSNHQSAQQNHQQTQLRGLQLQKFPGQHSSSNNKSNHGFMSGNGASHSNNNMLSGQHSSSNNKSNHGFMSGNGASHSNNNMLSRPQHMSSTSQPSTFHHRLPQPTPARPSLHIGRLNSGYNVSYPSMNFSNNNINSNMSSQSSSSSSFNSSTPRTQISIPSLLQGSSGGDQRPS